MTKITATFPAAALVLALFSQMTLADDAMTIGEEYKIQPGDVLQVSVWKEEGLAGQVLVRPDGGISFPLVGNIIAAGKSISTLQQIVTERLIKYIPEPVVTVSTIQLSGNKVYVIGKVARPGEIPATHYIDIVQALSVAGGMTPYAAANKIKVLRRENGVMTAIPFRYGDIEKGEDLEQNIILRSGDVVLVP